MLRAKVAVARAAGAAARRAGRGGTSFPGKLLLRLAPAAIGELAGRLESGSVVLSATNGKTTTAAMVASILEGRGEYLVHNRAGANMAGGIATALADATRRGRPQGDRGLFEVDEFWLAPVVKQLQPRAVLLANLFRDQLDRYGELETIADRWSEVVTALPNETALVLNADDPLIADLGRVDGGVPRRGVSYFGIDDASLALAELQHASDSKHCRRCGAAYRYDAIYLGHLGHYSCPSCGQRRPEPDVTAVGVTLHGVKSAGFTLLTGSERADVALPLPGLYNVYNALAAAALCLRLGVPLAQIAAGLASVAPAFGRAETITVGERELVLLLIKNPAGANEVLRTLGLEGRELDVVAFLNDQIADGRDVSWIWDADMELLRGRVRHVTCGGTRAAELALRLRYAGVERDRIAVVPGLSPALDAALADGIGTLYALPTYTALLGLRDDLAQRGHAARYWA
jgi:UDP-N-acetylmuramyl tripeptide synthase